MGRIAIGNVLVLLASAFASFQLGCTNPPLLEQGAGGENAGAAGKGGGGGGGTANTGGRGGTPGAGGSSAGTGGSGGPDAGGGSGTGDTRSVSCTATTEITVGAFTRVAGSFDPTRDALYTATISSPMLGAMDVPDTLDLEFAQFDELMLNGAATGGFNLVNDSVRQTCSRCVMVRVDSGATELLAQSGVLTVNGASPVDGTLDATLTNVTLSRIGGAPLGTGEVCLHVASASAKIDM